MPTKQPPTRIDEGLRWYLQNCGLSLSEVERQSGVSNSQLSRFVRSERNLNLENAASPAEHLGLKLVKRRD